MADEELRLTLESETILEDDPAPLKRIRYIFTLVMPQQMLPNNPLMSKVYLDKVLGDINEKIKPERIGVVAVTEVDGDGKLDSGRTGGEGWVEIPK